jgi:hypothetical protein
VPKKTTTTTRTVTQTAAPQSPAVVAAAPVPATQVPKIAPAPAASKPTAPPLDLRSLETRLRQTKAIGLLTKLSLKNQVDDLVNRFRAYHKRQATTTLDELRRSYDMLLLKVLSLLQDSDPALARDIVKSRAAIWSILEDPEETHRIESDGRSDAVSNLVRVLALISVMTTPYGGASLAAEDAASDVTVAKA